MQLPHAAHTVYSNGFYSDDGRDYAIRILLGNCNSRAADAGEVLSTIDAVGDGHDRDWYEAWHRLGRRLTAEADDSARRGHNLSAAWTYLRAATYLAEAFDALDGIADDTERMPVFAEHRAAWENFVDHGPFVAQRISIPYEHSTLPGWYFSPVDAGDSLRPTLVMVNGSDGPVSGQWSSAADGALQRGYRVVMFDGPGQQSMLFEHGTFFRPDWEAVLTPVTDVVVGLPGVDTERLAVYGISQAGYWVPRAIAFEHRFAAAIADPGVVAVDASWLPKLGHALQKKLAEGKDHDFDQMMSLGMKASRATKRLWDWRARPYGQDTYSGTMKAVSQYTLTADVAANIRTPMLITSPEAEQFWPGQSDQLAAMSGGDTTVVPFRAAEGASWHCQPMARALTEQRMFDWLDETLAIV
ncbi:dipeptidyl aminopeptidase [Gordonia sp. LSe1-13]|uniref:Dipeptidyl aminopeptidase n=1 Tax=Gordonia sesuvii TaxID=3116777 RepID=A0ABU7MBI5_9ACTN|nr:dipeptidyl aminopeptidase [Gordonia sp. LSe1-13]